MPHSRSEYETLPRDADCFSLKIVDNLHASQKYLDILDLVKEGQLCVGRVLVVSEPRSCRLYVSHTGDTSSHFYVGQVLLIWGSPQAV